MSRAGFGPGPLAGVALPAPGGLQTRDGFLAALTRGGDDGRAGRVDDGLRVACPGMGRELRRRVGAGGPRTPVDAVEAGAEFESTCRRLEAHTW